MISLAINIPIMGFILVEGVRASLGANLPPGVDIDTLQSVAERIAAGTAAASAHGISEETVHQALSDGFGLVMLYGSISVWLLAAVSFMIFGPARKIDAR